MSPSADFSSHFGDLSIPKKGSMMFLCINVTYYFLYEHISLNILIQNLLFLNESNQEDIKKTYTFLKIPTFQVT